MHTTQPTWTPAIDEVLRLERIIRAHDTSPDRDAGPEPACITTARNRATELLLGLTEDQYSSYRAASLEAAR